MRLLRWGGAATVSLSIVAGLVLVLPSGGRTTAVPTVHVAYGTPLDLDRARPADQVWPQAVLRMPSKLADGRGYTPVRSMGAGRVIVEPIGGFAGYYPPEIMSINTGQTTVLTPLTAGPGVSKYRWTGATTSAHYLLWTMAGVRAGVSFAEVWSMPLTGGAATRLAVPDIQPPDGLLTGYAAFEAGADVYLSVRTASKHPTAGSILFQSQIYRIGPGGALTPLAGSAGDWPVGGGPWLRLGSDGSAAVALGFQSALPSGRWQGEGPLPVFWNPATGEHRTPPASNLSSPVCGPDRCVARDGKALVAYRYNGAGGVAVTSAAGDYLGPDVFGPRSGDGRFTAFWVRQPDSSNRAYLWDVDKHRVGVLGPMHAVGDHMAQLSDDDQQKVVIDLDRIP